MVTSDENTYGDRNTLDNGQFSPKTTLKFKYKHAS